MRQRDVFSDQASIASWALFTLHRKKLYEYRNANGVKISVKMRSPEHYAVRSQHLAGLKLQSSCWKSGRKRAWPGLPGRQSRIWPTG
ncbi:hypothetical protein EGX56_22455 [Escherichia coli]|nr:hypothetical protein [Escherichia coli]EFN7722842.1 hypothetical protein [Escherichia coli]EFN7792498.1 hypothetical protein [Escherichia coli]